MTKLVLVLIIFVVYSCQQLENITQKEKLKNTEIIDNDKYETSEFLSLNNNFETRLIKYNVEEIYRLPKGTQIMIKRHTKNVLPIIY